jgi:hypothetical protein
VRRIRQYINFYPKLYFLIFTVAGQLPPRF